MATRVWLASCLCVFFWMYGAPAFAQFYPSGPDGMYQQGMNQAEPVKIEPIYDVKEQVGEMTDDSAIVKAIIDNNHRDLRQAIEGGADVNAPTKDGSYPVILASIFGDVELLKILTAYNVDVTAKDAYGRNAMHYLAMMGDTEKAKFLMIMDSTFADEADKDAISPLYYAYLNNHMNMAEFLVTLAQARVNRIDLQGDHLAFTVVSQVDNPAVIQHMLRNSLNVFKRNRRDYSLAEVAEFEGHMQSANMLKAEYDRILNEFKARLQRGDEQQQQQNQNSGAGFPNANPGYNPNSGMGYPNNNNQNYRAPGFPGAPGFR